MDLENPTTGDSGASIEDRLVKYLSADETPAQPKEAETSQETKAPETAEKPTEVPDNGDPEDDKQPQLSTADLAKVLGVDESALDVDSDGNISVKTKIDGKEGAAKFADLLKTYQLQGHAENRARAVAEQEKALQARSQEVEQAYQQRLQYAEQVTNLAYQELMREAQALEQHVAQNGGDPGQIAYAKMQLQERAAKINQALQGINTQRGQMSQQAQIQHAQRLQAEAERLPTLIPEWKDAAVAAKEQKEIIEWGLKRGYSREAMNSLSNSTALDIATFRDAMMQDRLRSSKAVVEAKVRTAPKLVKSGSSPVETEETRARSLKQSVIKSGGKNNTLEAWLIKTGKV